MLLFIRVYRIVSALFPAALLWIGIAAPSANADITYDYVGNPFTRCSFGPCPVNYTSDYIIASISFSAPLGDNLPLTDETSSLTAWTLSDADGYFSFSSTGTTALMGLLLSTDSKGNIMDYGMETNPFAGPGTGAVIANPTFIGGSGNPVADAFNNSIWAVSNATPGHWTETPEPSSLLLTLSIGTVLIIAIRRKHRTRPPAQRAL